MTQFRAICSCGAMSIAVDGRHCSGCHEAKPATQFYAHAQAPDGKRSQCKVCYVQRQRAAVAAKPGGDGPRARRYRAAHPEFRAKRVSYERRDPARWRRRHRAGEAVRRAIAKGVLRRPDACEKCGGGGPIEAAHSDYDRPLHVQWLCRRCHRRWDAAEPKLGPCHEIDGRRSYLLQERAAV